MNLRHIENIIDRATKADIAYYIGCMDVYSPYHLYYDSLGKTELIEGFYKLLSENGHGLQCLKTFKGIDTYPENLACYKSKLSLDQYFKFKYGENYTGKNLTDAEIDAWQDIKAKENKAFYNYR